jgi:hypothetical protein
VTRAKKSKISPVTKVTENLQIFSSPKVSKPLPEVTGPVTVSFKHEDSISGMAIGPVVVTAREPYAEWLKIHGVPRTSRSGETHYLRPFRSVPAGRHDLGWVTRHVAGEIAAHYGVTLEEF